MSHDPVRLELVKNAIGSVVDEMVLTIVRIAYSSIMKDTMDLSSAFCDRQGRMIAQGLSLPLHLGSLPDAMEAVLEQCGDDVAPGDVIILNDPYEAGGMHLPDIFMFMPVFVERAPPRVRGAGRALQRHGGPGAGVERGRLDRDLPGGAPDPGGEAHRRRRAQRGRVPDDRDQRPGAGTWCWGTSTPSSRRAASASGGCARSPRATASPSSSSASRTSSTTASGRPAPPSSRFRTGTYRFADHLDDDGVVLDEPVPIRVAVEVRGSDVIFDFAGSSSQVRGAINCTLSFVRSAVYFALRSIMESDAPNNSGFFRPVEVRAEPGSLLNPRPPGACAARRSDRIPGDRRHRGRARRSGSGSSARAGRRRHHELQHLRLRCRGPVQHVPRGGHGELGRRIRARGARRGREPGRQHRQRALRGGRAAGPASGGALRARARQRRGGPVAGRARGAAPASLSRGRAPPSSSDPEPPAPSPVRNSRRRCRGRPRRTSSSTARRRWSFRPSSCAPSSVDRRPAHDSGGRRYGDPSPGTRTSCWPTCARQGVPAGGGGRVRRAGGGAPPWRVDEAATARIRGRGWG